MHVVRREARPGRPRAVWFLWILSAPALLLLLSTLVPLRLPEPVIPTQLLGRAYVVRPGVRDSDLVQRLEQLRYREVSEIAPRPGEFRRLLRDIVVNRRAFRGPGEAVAPARFDVRLDRRGNAVRILDAYGARVREMQLDPPLVGTLQQGEHVSRTLVALDDLPAHFLDAVLVTEDRRFYSHRGLDERRMIGAALANLRAWGVVQGGSTLTQQLVKNVYVGSERTLLRKLGEAWLALRVERGHSKDEILEAYLNTIYLGQQGAVSVRGVEAAARHYFGKSAGELSVSESALLAGMIRGPGFYSPFTRPERALERRNRVLALLRTTGKISGEQYRASAQEPLGSLSDAPKKVFAPYFVAKVVRDLAEAAAELEPDRESLVIHTGLDALLQQHAQSALRRGLERLERDYPKLAQQDVPLQAALIVIEPETGAILAHVGGRDWGKSQFDRATQTRRQPGSVFKPIVALTALARNRETDFPPYTLASILEDEPLEVETDDGAWTPQNLGGEFRGPISLRLALENSVNVPIARLGLEIGPRAIVRTARRLGIRSRLRAVPSLALGSSEVSPLEIAGAYGVLATGGRRAKLRSFFSVHSRDGAVLHEAARQSDRAFAAAEIALVTSALQGAVDHGTGRGLRYAGFRGSVAGKTGTTNDTRDAWFVGYTPELAAAVWVGFDDGRSHGLTGSRAALPIFADFLIAALGRDGGREFERPQGLEEVLVNARTGLRAGLGCWGEPELFLWGTAPEGSCGWFGEPIARGRSRSRGSIRW